MREEQRERQLQQELRELRHENARLRQRVNESGRHAKRVEQAYKDALQLALWHCAHITPSRSYAAYQKMSQRRWQNAMGLLRFARVVSGSRRWVTRELQLIESRLTAARSRALTTPAAYRARLNRHGQQ